MTYFSKVFAVIFMASATFLFSGGAAMSQQVDPIQASKARFEAILDNVSRTETGWGGGGISSIRELRANVFEVTIAREEAPQTLIFEVSGSGTNVTAKQIE